MLFHSHAQTLSAPSTHTSVAALTQANVTHTSKAAHTTERWECSALKFHIDVNHLPYSVCVATLPAHCVAFTPEQSPLLPPEFAP
ncbi:unnamed protein product [Leptosia nina]|uniref:Uncharacterized protein n=1 Tax=Leptosia nina TaxID=320188 RepID=A0AAV1J9N9_9NEOP